MAIEYLNLTSDYYGILYKDIGSEDNMKLLYEDGSPLQFETKQEATEKAISSKATKEFYIVQFKEPLVDVPTSTP